MFQPYEEEFLTLHREHSLTVYDLAKVFRMPMGRVERILARAKDYDRRCLDKLLAVIEGR